MCFLILLHLANSLHNANGFFSEKGDPAVGQLDFLLFMEFCTFCLEPVLALLRCLWLEYGLSFQFLCLEDIIDRVFFHYAA